MRVGIRQFDKEFYAFLRLYWCLPKVIVGLDEVGQEKGKTRKVLSWVSLLFDMRADVQCGYLRVAFCELGVQRFVCCQHGLGQF